MKKRHHKFNSVIKILTISDIMIMSGYGFISPIFAIFIADSIQNGNIQTIGIASAIYSIAQCAFQIPIGIILDKLKGEKDDFWALFIGSMIFSIIPLFYITIHTPAQLYILQFLYGLATAATIPAWYAIFTRHIDKNREGIEWGAYKTTTGIGIAAAEFLGGYWAYRYGFPFIFILMSGSSFIGSIVLLYIYKKMKPGYIFTNSQKTPRTTLIPQKNILEN